MSCRVKLWILLLVLVLAVYRPDTSCVTNFFKPYCELVRQNTYYQETVKYVSGVLTKYGVTKYLVIGNSYYREYRAVAESEYGRYCYTFMAHWKKYEPIVVVFLARLNRCFEQVCVATQHHYRMSVVPFGVRVWNAVLPYLEKCCAYLSGKWSEFLAEHENVSQYVDGAAEYAGMASQYAAAVGTWFALNNTVEIFYTSTITMTATVTSDFAAATIGAQHVMEYEPASFENWYDTLSFKSENAVVHLKNEVFDLEHEVLEQLKKDVQEDLQGLNKVASKYFQMINTAIFDIDSTQRETEEGTLYYDKKGNTIDHRIERDEVRNLFLNASAELTEVNNLIYHKLESKIHKFNKDIEALRLSHVEIFEEWGELAVNEWGTKLVYTDFVDSTDDSFDNWKQYVALKKDLIRQRDELVTVELQVSDIEKFLGEIKTTLALLANDSGEYLAILRAKANLEFQAREKAEFVAEQKRIAEAEAEQKRIAEAEAEAREQAEAEAEAREQAQAEAQAQANAQAEAQAQARTVSTESHKPIDITLEDADSEESDDEEFTTDSQLNQSTGKQQPVEPVIPVDIPDLIKDEPEDVPDLTDDETVDEDELDHVITKYRTVQITQTLLD